MLGYMTRRKTNIHWRILAFRLQKIFQQFSTIWQNKYDNVLCCFNQCLSIIFVQNRPKKDFFDCFVPTLVFPNYLSCGPEQVWTMDFSWGIIFVFPQSIVWHIPSFSSFFAVCLLSIHFWLSFCNSSYHGCLQYSNTFHPQMLAKKLPKELIKESKRCLRFGFHCYAENLLYAGKVKNFWNLSKHDFECPE